MDKLDLWVSDDEKLETASTHRWFLFIRGYVVIRSLGQIQPPEIATYLVNRLESGISTGSILSDLEGSFVIAAWDASTHTLHLAGDRVGSQTIYYFKDKPGFFLCSSHPQWICETLDHRELDPESLHLYLGLKGIPAPWTPIRGVKKVCPGSLLQIRRNQVQQIDYWDALEHLSDGYAESFENASQEFIKKLDQAILQYSADQHGKPIGVFLSGGLDSTLLASMAHRHHLRLKAFTAGYSPAFRTDETHHAALVTEWLGIDHEICRLDSLRLNDLVTNEIIDLPEPVADPSFWPQLNLAKTMVDQVSAIFDGTGADSLLGGSNKFAVKKYANLYKKIPPFIRKQIISPVSALFPSSRHTQFSNWIRLLQVFIQGCEVADHEQDIYYSRFFQPEIESRLLKAELNIGRDLSGHMMHNYHRQVDEYHAVAAAGYMTLKAVQPWVELLKLTCIEQKTGLSIRKPFLYSSVIEFNLLLPDEYKVRAGQGKAIQKKASEELVPAEILKRRKANFSPPVGRWLSEDLKGLFFDVIQESGPFNLTFVHKLYGQQDRGFRDWQSELWAILMWQMWWNAL